MMTHDQNIGVARHHLGRVGHGLAFGRRRSFHVRAGDHRAAEPLHGRFERQPRARARFVEQRRHDLPGADPARAQLVGAIRQRKDLLDLIVGQVGNGNQTAHIAFEELRLIATLDSGFSPANGQNHLIRAVGLIEQYVDPLAIANFNVLADNIGANRQLTGAAIDQRRD